MRFREEQVGAFAALSHDRSPLHVDAGYARRTPFGRTVLHGVAGVLAVIGTWARGRPVCLERLAARFHKPLLPGEDYELQTAEEAGVVSLELSRSGLTLLAIELALRPAASGWATTFPKFFPRAAARTSQDPSPARLPAFDYAPALEPGLLAAFGLRADQIPAQQLAALAWSSYFVGMEAPGRQALFASLDLRFGPPEPGPFQLRDLEVRIDERFARTIVTATGVGIAALELVAFQRPTPVDAGLEAVRSAVGPGRPFAGKTVLVTGSSRGFGAAAARAFALAGANLVLSARTESPELSRVADDVASCGTSPILLIGDAMDGTSAARIAELAPTIDLLINNAIPPIPSEPFLATPREHVEDWIARAIALVAVPSRAFIGRARSGAYVVNISSSFTREPQPRFASYVAAKAAVEALTRVLALEHPELGFVIVRPPRMLTDQTNAVVKVGPLASPAQLAAALLQRLAPLLGAAGLRELDL